jgi:hypothetical protein
MMTKLLLLLTKKDKDSIEECVECITKYFYQGEKDKTGVKLYDLNKSFSLQISEVSKSYNEDYDTGSYINFEFSQDSTVDFSYSYIPNRGVILKSGKSTFPLDFENSVECAKKIDKVLNIWNYRERISSMKIDKKRGKDFKVFLESLPDKLLYVVQ